VQERPLRFLSRHHPREPEGHGALEHLEKEQGYEKMRGHHGLADSLAFPLVHLVTEPFSRLLELALSDH